MCFQVLGDLVIMIKFGQILRTMIMGDPTMAYSVSKLRNLYLVSGADSFNRLVRQLYDTNVPWWKPFSSFMVSDASDVYIQNSIRIGFLNAYPEVFEFNRHYAMSRWLKSEYFISGKVGSIGKNSVIEEDKFILSLFDLLISEFGDRMIEFKFNNGNSI